MTKIEKLIKIGNIEEENSLYLLNELSNFNEIFSEDVTYDNIKSPKKTGIHDFSESNYNTPTVFCEKSKMVSFTSSIIKNIVA